MQRLAPVLLTSIFLVATAARAEEPPAADPAGPAGPAAPVDPSAAAAGAVPTAPMPRVREPAGSLPFRLGLFYAHAFEQSGDLNQGPSPAAVGIDLGLGLGQHVRYHIGIANEWESRGAYSAKGLRLDLVTLGFPILVVANQRIAIHVEPLIHLVRGEILFPADNVPGPKNDAYFRIDSGVAVAVTAVMSHWFVGLEPVSVDFRSFAANTKVTNTGFSRLFWFQVSAGYEF